MNPWLTSAPFGWQAIVDAALSEDVGHGDVSGSILPSEPIRWYIESQAEGVVAGAGIVEYLLRPMHSAESIQVLVSDGTRVAPSTRIVEGVLDVRQALQRERTALNFLMLLSGVATLTRQYVDAVEGTQARIVDTRKTIPLLRSLQKYAVRCGGGHNHRMGLSDGAMFKDNHLAAAGSITEAVKRFRAESSHMTKLEVECETPAQVAEAVRARVEVIMLDNMSPELMKSVVEEYRGQAIFEASGGINLSSIRAAAESGVNVISVGALTHSAPSLAYHMEFE